MFLHKIEKTLIEDYYYVDNNFFYVRIYRWNPYLSIRPWFNIFPLKIKIKFVINGLRYSFSNKK